MWLAEMLPVCALGNVSAVGEKGGNPKTEITRQLLAVILAERGHVSLSLRLRLFDICNQPFSCHISTRQDLQVVRLLGQQYSKSELRQMQDPHLRSMLPSTILWSEPMIECAGMSGALWLGTTTAEAKARGLCPRNQLIIIPVLTRDGTLSNLVATLTSGTCCAQAR